MQTTRLLPKKILTDLPFCERDKFINLHETDGNGLAVYAANVVMAKEVEQLRLKHELCVCVCVSWELIVWHNFQSTRIIIESMDMDIKLNVI